MGKRILSIQDISCVGQCSLTVALPILSAFGFETAVLPTAVLSNHTGGFSEWTFADLTDEIPKIGKMWEKHGINFDAIYTGYVGSVRQIGLISQIIGGCLGKGGKVIVDPVLGDNGKLYAGFDGNYVDEMKKLVSLADVALPNITEACFLTGTDYIGERQEKEQVEELLQKLLALGCRCAVLTGVSLEDGLLGLAVNDGSGTEYRFEKFVDRKRHGTGDVFASAFTGAVMKGESYADAGAFAAKFVIESILATVPDEDHWYGVNFEKSLRTITDKYNK